MNDARAKEEAIPGTPAFELQEAHALYADLMANDLISGRSQLSQYN